MGIGTMRDNRWNPHGGYETGPLIVGMLFFIAMVFTVVIVAIYPQFMTQAVDVSGKYNNVVVREEEEEIVMKVQEDEAMGVDDDEELVKYDEVQKKEKNEKDANETAGGDVEEEAAPKETNDADAEKSDFVD